MKQMSLPALLLAAGLFHIGSWISALAEPNCNVTEECRRWCRLGGGDPYGKTLEQCYFW